MFGFGGNANIPIHLISAGIVFLLLLIGDLFVKDHIHNGSVCPCSAEIIEPLQIPFDQRVFEMLHNGEAGLHDMLLPRLCDQGQGQNAVAAFAFRFCHSVAPPFAVSDYSITRLMEKVKGQGRTSRKTRTPFSKNKTAPNASARRGRSLYTGIFRYGAKPHSASAPNPSTAALAATSSAVRARS